LRLGVRSTHRHRGQSLSRCVLMPCVTRCHQLGMPLKQTIDDTNRAGWIVCPTLRRWQSHANGTAHQHPTNASAQTPRGHPSAYRSKGLCGKNRHSESISNP
jgi:hypothetical protein